MSKIAREQLGNHINTLRVAAKEAEDLASDMVFSQDKCPLKPHSYEEWLIAGLVFSDGALKYCPMCEVDFPIYWDGEPFPEGGLIIEPDEEEWAFATYGFDELEDVNMP